VNQGLRFGLPVGTSQYSVYVNYYYLRFERIRKHWVCKNFIAQTLNGKNTRLKSVFIVLDFSDLSTDDAIFLFTINLHTYILLYVKRIYPYYH